MARCCPTRPTGERCRCASTPSCATSARSSRPSAPPRCCTRRCRRPARPRSRSSPPPPTPTSAARRCSARALTPPAAATRVLFSVDGRQVCEATARAVRMQLGSRRHHRRASDPRGRRADGRRTRHPDGADQGARLRGKSRRRRRPDHRDGHRRHRTLRDGAAAVGVSRSRKTASRRRSRTSAPRTCRSSSSSPCDVSGSMTPAMPRLKKAVKEFLGAVPSRDQVTLLGFNDSIFAAHAARRRSGRAHQGRRPAGAVGRDGAVRRHPARRGHARQAARAPRDGRLQRRRGSGQPRVDHRRRAAAAGERRDALHDRPGPRRGSRRAQDRHAAAGRADRRTGAVHGQHRSAARRVRPICSRSCRTSTCSATSRRNARRDDTFRKISVQVDGQPHVRARQGYRAMAPKYDATGQARRSRHSSSSSPPARPARSNPHSRPRRRRSVPLGRRSAARRRHRRRRSRPADPRSASPRTSPSASTAGRGACVSAQWIAARPPSRRAPPPRRRCPTATSRTNRRPAAG